MKIEKKKKEKKNKAHIAIWKYRILSKNKNKTRFYPSKILLEIDQRQWKGKLTLIFWK